MFEIGKEVYMVMGLEYLPYDIDHKVMDIKLVETFIYHGYIAGIHINQDNEIQYDVSNDKYDQDSSPASSPSSEVETIYGLNENLIVDNYHTAFMTVYNTIKNLLNDKKNEIEGKFISLENMKEMIESSMFTNPTAYPKRS